MAAAAAAIADDLGFPLLIDLRPGLVIVDSGKDQWEDDAHGLEAQLHRPRRKPPDCCPRGRGHGGPRAAALRSAFLDAADVAAVRAFWVAALGYTHDRRAGASDIYDPRRLNPVLVFQELDASDTERRRQRNRIHFELAVPSDLAATRLATTVAAGGRLLDESEDRWRVADPEGNELVIVTGDEIAIGCSSTLEGRRPRASMSAAISIHTHAGLNARDEQEVDQLGGCLRVLGPGQRRWQGVCDR